MEQVVFDRGSSEERGLDFVIPETNDPPMKWCSNCRSYKEPTSENFSKNRSNKDGLQDFCKPCHRTWKDRQHGN